MEQAGRLIVRVAVPEGDDDELDVVTRHLLAEIRDSGSADSAELAATLATPRGAKSGDPVQVGQLILTVTATAVPALVAMLRAWSQRPRTAPVKVALKLARGEIDVEYPVGAMTHEHLMELVAAVTESASSDAAGLEE